MLEDMEAEGAAQNSRDDVNSYTNRGDGSQNITGRKSNSGKKAGDRIYNITNNYATPPAKKKTTPRKKTSNISYDTNESPYMSNSHNLSGGSSGIIILDKVYPTNKSPSITDNGRMFFHSPNRSPGISNSQGNFNGSMILNCSGVI